MRTNKAVKLSGDKKNVGSLKEMTAAMKEMPQFQEQFSKVCGDCFFFKKKNNSIFCFAKSYLFVIVIIIIIIY